MVKSPHALLEEVKHVLVVPTVPSAPVAASLLPAIGLRAMGMPVGVDAAARAVHRLDLPHRLLPHAVVLETQ